MKTGDSGLTPEQVQRMKDLFAAALKLDSGERAAFVADAYRRDDTLRAGVESIVTTSGEAPATQAEAAAAMPESMIGRRLGPYQIVEQIGRGGMGVVYLAGRADGEFKKQVAIKLLRAGPDSEEILRRFRTERQILASLDHPNIVKMLDGGATPEGLPYFVMDYVPGVPIDAYCAAHKLATVDRLQLFRQVCAAVHYAHQRLVVHRDLKPSNILVTGEGVPKLLDFGIAKLLKPGLAEVIEMTGAGIRLMTPEYASPEQARGEPVTTATDVYALGVILYELLSGRRPYRVKDIVLHELMRAICEEEPEPPSTAVLQEAAAPDTRQTHGVRPDHLSRQLRGDLDNIALMALRKEPARRYSSAEQFSEDVRRYLERLPVIARKDTARYRTGKFIRRHRIGVAASVLLVLSLMGGIVSTAWQARIAERQRARAEQRFHEVRELSGRLLTEFHDAILTLPGATKPREVVVKRGLEYLDRLAGDAAADRALQRELALGYERMGSVQGNPRLANLGDAAGALKSYGKSLAIRQALYDSGPTLERRRELAQSHMLVGDMHWTVGDKEQARRHYDLALALSEESAAEQPKGIAVRREVAMNRQNLGDLLLEGGDIRGAAEHFGKALAICEQLAKENPADWRHTRDLALAHNKVGDALWYGGDLKGALGHYSSALADREKLAAAHPADALLRRELIPAFHNVGDTLEKLGDLKGALASFRKSLDVAATLAAADARNTQAQRDLCLTHARVGGIELKLGRHRAALESFRSERAIAEKMTAEDPANTLPRRDLADALFNIAEAHKAASDCRRARGFYRESLAIYADLARRGLLSAADSAIPKQVEEKIAACEAALTSPGGL